MASSSLHVSGSPHFLHTCFNLASKLAQPTSHYLYIAKLPSQSICFFMWMIYFSPAMIFPLFKIWFPNYNIPFNLKIWATFIISWESIFNKRLEVCSLLNHIILLKFFNKQAWSRLTPSPLQLISNHLPSLMPYPIYLLHHNTICSSAHCITWLLHDWISHIQSTNYARTCITLNHFIFSNLNVFYATSKGLQIMIYLFFFVSLLYQPSQTWLGRRQ